jgi:hypothetical protein
MFHLCHNHYYHHYLPHRKSILATTWLTATQEIHPVKKIRSGNPPRNCNTLRESTLQSPSPPGQLFINLLITEGSGPFITANTADIRFNFAQRCTLSLQVVITHMPGVAKPHNTSEVSGQGSLRDLSQVPAASRRPTMRRRRTAPALQSSKTQNTVL